MFQTPVKKPQAALALHDCLSQKMTRPMMPGTAVQAVVRPEPNLHFRNAICCVLNNVLTVDECNAIIHCAHAQGFQPALLNVGGGRQVYAPETRNSERVIMDDAQFANRLFQRMQHVLPTSYASRPIVGLNERMRILRYGPGDVFAPHRDGSFQRPDGRAEESYWTVMIYLNHVTEGGSTLIYSDDGAKSVAIVPKPGLVLVFDHRLLHEGQVVKQGSKYAIRTDMMFDITAYSK